MTVNMPTINQMKYIQYAMRDVDDMFPDWFLENENKQTRYSQRWHRFIDLINELYLTKRLSFDIVSLLIGAHKRDDYESIRKIIADLEEKI